MPRSSALRTSIAALAILPAFTACSMIPGVGKTEATPQPVSVAPQASTDSSKDNESTNQSGTEQSPDSNQTGSADESSDSNDTSSDDQSSDTGSADDDSTNDSSGGEPSDVTGNSGGSTDDDASSGSSNSGGSSSGARQKIAVPAGSGISNLELIDIKGAPSSSGQHAQIVALFNATTDRPMMLNIKIQLFDASGKQIATNTGLNSVYTTGTHDLVTSNLIELPKGATVKTFKASLVDKTDMSKDFSISRISKPQVAPSPKFDKQQVLRGTVTIRGTMDGHVEVNAGCRTSNGRIYHGQETISDNPVKNGQVEYEIPMYSTEGMDLNNMTCYVSD
ncbi:MULTISPECIES: hypothetical protein [unclassified Luteococcus]|uniref:hypothetical protein n=1 Tax=unclassified Luteococcus TaxID=2639923 RepID=UPI00313C6852